MKQKPIQIPDDIAAKYSGEGQFERFDEAFKAVIQVPAESIPDVKDIPKRHVGRPSNTEKLSDR